VQAGGAPTLLIDPVAPAARTEAEPRPATGAAVTHEAHAAAATSVAGAQSKPTRWGWALVAAGVALVGMVGVVATRGRERPSAEGAAAVSPLAPPPSAVPAVVAAASAAPPVMAITPDLSPPDASVPHARRSSPHPASAPGAPAAPRPAPAPSAHSPSDPNHPLFFPR
jgi:hypothetical protein